MNHRNLDHALSYAFIGAMCMDVLYNEGNTPDPSIAYNSTEAMVWCFVGFVCAVGFVIELATWITHPTPKIP